MRSMPHTLLLKDSWGRTLLHVSSEQLRQSRETMFLTSRKYPGRLSNP